MYHANGTGENHLNCLARQAIAYFRFTFFPSLPGYIAILSLMIFCSSFVVYVACGDDCDGNARVLLLVKMCIRKCTG